MSKIPSLNYQQIVNALQRDAWKVIRQKGSHIRLEKMNQGEIMKLTVPAHKPVKRSTLSHILKQAYLTVEEFNDLV